MLTTITTNSWHETQAIYSCDFQPLPAAQLKRLLPTAADDDDKGDKAPVTTPRQYRLATCGGDFKVRVSSLRLQQRSAAGSEGDSRWSCSCSRSRP